MSCQVDTYECRGPVSNRAFVWHNTSLLHNKGDTTIECRLCADHYTLLLHANHGQIPEVTGSDCYDALAHLLSPLDGVQDDRPILDMTEYADTFLQDCASCTNYALHICERCNLPVCSMCKSRKGYYCCWMVEKENTN